MRSRFDERWSIGLAAAMAISVVTCRGHQRRMPGPPASAAPATPLRERRAAPVQAPSPSGSARAPAILPRFGYATVPRLPGPDAVAANSRGLQQYRAKKLDAALRLFQQAVRSAPDYDLARYNAACVMALLQQHAASAAELSGLLRRDLPRFLPRLAADTDLETLRASARGQALMREANSLHQTWLELARRGIPAVAWIPYVPRSGAGLDEPPHVRSRWFRAGVWVHDTRRFLPLVPPVPDALAALVDVQAARALVVSAPVEPCLFDMCPRLGEVSVTYFDSLVPRQAPASRSLPGQSQLVLSAVSVELGSTGPRWVLGEGRVSVWRELADGHPIRAPEQGWAGKPRVVAGVLGTRLVHLPEGWKARPHELLDARGRSIPLPRRFQGAELQLELLPGGKQGLLVAQWAGCECERAQQSVLRYGIEILDLDRRQLSPWLQGAASASIRVGPGGGVYVQRDRRLERYEGVGVGARSERVPNGVVLTPPMIPDENCCGL